MRWHRFANLAWQLIDDSGATVAMIGGPHPNGLYSARLVARDLTVMFPTEPEAKRWAEDVLGRDQQ